MLNFQKRNNKIKLSVMSQRKNKSRKHTRLVCKVGYRYGKLTGYPIYDVEVAVNDLSIDRLKELSKMDDPEFKDSVNVLLS